MTEELLDATCVIEQLCSQKIIAPCSTLDWYSLHPNDCERPVYFASHADNIDNDKTKPKGDVCLQIIKRSGNYYTPRSRINNLSIKYKIDTDIIYSACSVRIA